MMGPSVELRTTWMQGMITVAGANCRIKLYNGTRPVTSGATITSQVLLATLIGGAVLGTAATGVLDVTEAGFTQDNTLHVSGTPTWFRLEKSTGAFVCDFSIPEDGVVTGNVVNGRDVLLQSPSTITA